MKLVSGFSASLKRVDVMLECFDLLSRSSEAADRPESPTLRHAKIGAEIEQVVSERARGCGATS
jgi:hypothetical protein